MQCAYLQPAFVCLGNAAVNPTQALLQADCAAAATAATANIVAVPGKVCSGEVAVVSNNPQKKFPGSTQVYDYAPTVTYRTLEATS